MSKVVDVLQEARDSYLNDPNSSTYTDAILLAKLKTAYGLMETALIEHHIQTKNEEETKIIPASTSSGSMEYSPLPNNLFTPVKMEERESGSTDRYRPMYLVRNIDSSLPLGPEIRYWSWRLDRIFLNKPSVEKEVKLYYQKLFPIIGTADDEVLGKVEQYLAAKTAALVYMFIEQSPTLAQVANEIAEAELIQIINIQTKIMQAVPIRRKPYVPFRFR